jgi:hypothetical protein
LAKRPGILVFSQVAYLRRTSKYVVLIAMEEIERSVSLGFLEHVLMLSLTFNYSWIMWYSRLVLVFVPSKRNSCTLWKQWLDPLYCIRASVDQIPEAVNLNQIFCSFFSIYSHDCWKRNLIHWDTIIHHRSTVICAMAPVHLIAGPDYCRMPAVVKGKKCFCTNVLFYPNSGYY